MKAAVLLVVVLLTSCASYGHKHSIEQANKVTNGMTREQVIEVMQGKPNRIENQGKTFVWLYSKVNMFSGRTESRSVRFNFDDNGITYGIPDGGAYGDIKKYQ